MIGKILTVLIMRALKKSIRQRADVTNRGARGSVGIAICALPLLVGLLFSGFAWLAVRDPDPDDQMAGYVVAAIAAGCFLLFVHYLTYEITVTDNLLLARSIFSREKVISFDRPFGLEYKEEKLVIRQNGKSIDINWTINGCDDLCHLLEQKLDQDIDAV